MQPLGWVIISIYRADRIKFHNLKEKGENRKHWWVDLKIEKPLECFSKSEDKKTEQNLKSAENCLY